MRRRFLNSSSSQEDIDYSEQYFTIEVLEDGRLELYTESGRTNCMYQLNDGNWIEYDYDYESLSVSKGDLIKLKGIGQTTYSELIFSDLWIDCKANVFGNIMSLLCGDDFKTADFLEEIPYLGNFRYLFFSSLIVSAKNLILPATTLSSYCYSYMFQDCTTLIDAPKLLPATILASDCYIYMFDGCTSLTTAPKLPATTLSNFCYEGMFSGCTSLTTPPELSATTLSNFCYQNMFYGCTKLNYIKMLATDISATSCLNNWVYNVASSGTFVKHPDMTSLPTGVNGIPNGWTTLDYEGMGQ